MGEKLLLVGTLNTIPSGITLIFIYPFNVLDGEMDQQDNKIVELLNPNLPQGIEPRTSKLIS